MATLTIERRSGRITGYNIQWREDKRRRTIYLSPKRYAKKTAERLKEIVEALLYYRRNGIVALDKSVEVWLQNASVEIRTKLEKAGLIIANQAKTCQQLWEALLKSKVDAKERTLIIYRRSQALFQEHFPPTEYIDKITAEQLLQWKAALQTRFASATVAGHLKNAKIVFNWAVEHEWLQKSPTRGISIGSFVNRDNDRIITMDEYAKLLDACPNQEWRAIIALARIGGLRCPSELNQLRWTDVRWSENRFLVCSPKTERHEGHRERLVPLFPELRLELQKHFSSREVDSEFVIAGHQGTSWNLNTTFRKISKVAGLGKIVRPFDNMRMSRSNEILNRFGPGKESLWIGHSARVMREHYLHLSDEDFLEASE